MISKSPFNMIDYALWDMVVEHSDVLILVDNVRCTWSWFPRKSNVSCRTLMSCNKVALMTEMICYDWQGLPPYLMFVTSITKKLWIFVKNRQIDFVAILRFLCVDKFSKKSGLWRKRQIWGMITSLHLVSSLIVTHVNSIQKVKETHLTIYPHK